MYQHSTPACCKPSQLNHGQCWGQRQILLLLVLPPPLLLLPLLLLSQLLVAASCLAHALHASHSSLLPGVPHSDTVRAYHLFHSCTIHVCEPGIHTSQESCTLTHTCSQ
jgi:hypothetical protein